MGSTIPRGRAVSDAIRTIVGALFMMACAYMMFCWVVELYLFFTDRQRFDERRQRRSITSGIYKGREVSVRDRLLFSYPILIVGSGLFGAMLFMR